jgi:hypothetical protein
MGYTTDFHGEFFLNKPLSKAHREYLDAFASTRRMRRKNEIVEKMDDPKRKAVGLNVGVSGGYFVGGPGHYGQDRDDSIIDYNQPPIGQPGLWCQWIANSDGTAIVWDGGEKFYNYIEWIEYLIKHFLAPWGYVLNGAVEWRGEDWNDTGTIVIQDNQVITHV